MHELEFSQKGFYAAAEKSAYLYWCPFYGCDSVYHRRVSNENKAREVEQRYHVSAKQLTSDGLLMKIISSSHPDIECWPCEASLEDAYIYLSNIKT